MIHETLGEDSRGFTRFWRGFARIHKTLEEDCETLGEDSQGITRLWERICNDSRDFGRGLARIHETLGEDLQ